MRRFLLFSVMIVLAFAKPAACQPTGAREVAPFEPTTLRGAPACPDMGTTLRRGRMLAAVNLPAVRKFYEAHGAECAWSKSNAEQLLDMVKAAADHGLAPELFHPDSLLWSGGTVSAGFATERDILLTDAALKYAEIINRGLSASQERDPDLAADYQPMADFIDGLIDALYSGDVGRWLTDLAPQYPAYIDLQASLARYRNIAVLGGWEQLPHSLVERKRRSDGFAALRTRLAAEGDLEQDSGSSRFDGSLRDAVLRFQRRNGLKADGKVSEKTIESLNVSVGQRIATLCLNLERLRATLRDMPSTRVEVNLPAATMLLYRDGEAVLAMNVVVGAPDHETPELSSIIDTIVLNPSWTIPQSIIQNEIRPQLKRHKNYLKKNHMYWLNDQLVQQPGPFNALGRIKFDFPNRYSVYLHDTPARRAFTDPERAASHGCVRLERPLELAAALLEDDDHWGRDALQAAIGTGLTKRIGLRHPMPVIINYLTAFADPVGTAHFRNDIYGRDTKLTLALAMRVEALRSKSVQW